MECLVGIENHDLTGTPTTFNETDYGQGHKECFNGAVNAVTRAILDCLEASDQLCICSSCRFLPEHKAMSRSSCKICPDCDVGRRDP